MSTVVYICVPDVFVTPRSTSVFYQCSAFPWHIEPVILFCLSPVVSHQEPPLRIRGSAKTQGSQIGSWRSTVVRRWPMSSVRITGLHLHGYWLSGKKPVFCCIEVYITSWNRDNLCAFPKYMMITRGKGCPDRVHTGRMAAV